jgi:hypothetical protein
MSETTPKTGKIRGRIVMIVRLLSPLRHGGDTVGNVQTFRRRGHIMPDGRLEQVPYLSGNSIKHFIREHSALFALEACGLTDGALSREQVHLFFSGGALTKGGQSVRFDEVRKAEAAFPVLGLCGYGAGNTLVASAIQVDDAIPICAQTQHLIQEEVDRYASTYERLFDQYAESFMSEPFGTRHEPTRQPHIMQMLKQTEADALALAIGESKDVKHADKGDSAQMIYNYEVMNPGAVLVGGFNFRHGVTPAQLAAFRSAFVHASEGTTSDGGIIVRFGGGSSTGCGKCAIYLHGLVAEGIEPWRYHKTDALCPPREEGQGFDEAMTEYIHQLRASAAEGLVATEGMV